MPDQTIADVEARLEAVRDGSRLDDVYAGQPEQFRDDLTALLASHRRMKEALTALDEAEALDFQHQELVAQADAEGWCETTGGSHLSDAWKHVAAAYEKARKQRRQALQGDAHEDR